MLKIGIIGMSPGNAHPYSWSAIVNGFFDGDEINKARYPGITGYLKANHDTLGIHGARVTHVWTQDRIISESIAKAAKVEYIVENAEDMAGQVDAVILARDDAESHVKMASPFIEADIPIFIDKPLAASHEDLAYFSKQNAQGKFIMSCSSMRYASECCSLKTELEALGEIELVTAVGKKDWLKYGIHMLEAIFALLGDPKPVLVKNVGESNKDVVCIEFANGIKSTVHLFMDIGLTFQISVFGKKGWRMIELKNFYAMFRDNLIEFIKSVQEGKPRLAFDKTEQLMYTLTGAAESLKHDGKTIHL